MKKRIRLAVSMTLVLLCVLTCASEIKSRVGVARFDDVETKFDVSCFDEICPSAE